MSAPTSWVPACLLTGAGLVGSTEWFEEYVSWAVPNVVAYLNVDVAVAGPHFSISGVPELHDIIVEIMKKIPAANNSSKTIYDDWAASGQSVGVLGSGSDYTAFIHSGIAAVSLITTQEQSDLIEI